MRGGRGESAALAAAILALLLLAVTQGPTATAQTPQFGAGIFSVNGSATETFSLSTGGSYYLTVATDDASSYVAASVTYNGSLMAEANHSLSESIPVSLPAGDYSISLTGRGRAALGWDFTHGSLQQFPDNQTLVAFLVPSGPRIHVNVVLGDAQAIDLRVFDEELRPAGNATVTAPQTVDFILPSLADGIAYITATVTAGNPSGLFGLSWTSDPLNPPIDFTTWPWFLLWILVPVAAAFVAFVLLHRRGSRAGGIR